MALVELQNHALSFRAKITICRLLTVAVSLVWFADSVQGQTEEPPIVRVSVKGTGAILGELIAENDKSIELFDFQANRSVSVAKTNVLRIENPVTLDDAARYAGLPAVMGRKIAQIASRQMPVGKIAKITPQIVYMTLGVSSGIKKASISSSSAVKATLSIRTPVTCWRARDRKSRNWRSPKSMRTSPKRK